MNKLNYIDLFAGCGGLSEGFSQSSLFNGVAHIEWEKPMVDTLRARLNDKWAHSKKESLERVIHFDIQKTHELLHGNWSSETKQQYGDTNSGLIQDIGLVGLLRDTPIDIIIGGPPCQAYSIAGRAQDKNQMKNDYRNYLFESFVAVVNQFRPKLFVFENVPGMLSAKPGNKLVTERIYEAFKSIGYSIKDPLSLKNTIYSASDFGVPQKRNRVIIIGIQDDLNYNLDEIYHNIDLQKIKGETSLFDAIGHLPKFYPLKNPIKKNGKNTSHEGFGETIAQHQPRYHNSSDIDIFKEWIDKKLNNLSQAEKLAYYNQKKGKSSNHVKYRSLSWNTPSPTIVAHLYKDGLMFIHPDSEQARSLTVREAAILQSFPMDYNFIGSMGYCYKMIGNAVPPLMAKKIALGIANFLGVK